MGGTPMVSDPRFWKIIPRAFGRGSDILNLSSREYASAQAGSGRDEPRGVNKGVLRLARTDL
eukprot:scaffold75761_cov32-Prasinocladus_malaysianus.AAC.2